MLVTDVDAPTGGVQRQSRKLLEHLRRRGMRAFVLARNYHRKPRREVSEGIEFYRTPVASRSLAAFNSLAYLIGGLRWLTVNRYAYDVIHCQQMFGPAMLALIAKPLLRKPVLVRVTSTGDLGEVRAIRGMALSGLRIRQLRSVDRWVALTEQMRTEILSLGVSPARVVVIPNGVVIPEARAYDATDRARARDRLGLGPGAIVVYSGRLSSEKAIDVLLRAWVRVRADHPSARLLLLGAGGQHRNVETELRGLADDLGLQDSVAFLGHVSNVGDYLAAADVFVLPSTTEGMSNAVLEAMATGVAIVATMIPANSEVVADDLEALLVGPRDEPALAASLCRLLSDPALRERLGRAARDKAERELSIGAVGDRYRAEYLALIAAGSS